MVLHEESGVSHIYYFADKEIHALGELGLLLRPKMTEVEVEEAFYDWTELLSEKAPETLLHLLMELRKLRQI